MTRVGGRRRRVAATLALAVASLLTVAAEPTPAQPRTHVHGQATLRVVRDGNALGLELDAPLESLLGFERAPRTAAERTALASLQARLADPARLFRLDAEARCSITASAVAVPPLDAPPPRQAVGEGHADVAASVAFACLEPERLRVLDVRLFDDHPALMRIVVETVGIGRAAGPARRELRRGATAVPLGRAG